MKIVKLFASAAYLAIAALPHAAYAWDGAKSGKITGLDVTDGQNYGFRVYLDGSPMCGTSEGWAYMNRDWDNYDAMAALLTSAYLGGKDVTIYTTKVGRTAKSDTFYFDRMRHPSP